MYFRWLAEADPQGELGRDAQNKIRIIQERRIRDRAIFLQK